MSATRSPRCSHRTACLPAEPLGHCLADRVDPFAGHKALEKAWDRARRAGHLTHVAADKIACRILGVHPAAVWGEAWWTPDDETPIDLWPAELDFDGTAQP